MVWIVDKVDTNAARVSFTSIQWYDVGGVRNFARERIKGSMVVELCKALGS